MRPKGLASIETGFGISTEVRRLRLILILLPREKDFSVTNLHSCPFSTSMMEGIMSPCAEFGSLPYEALLRAEKGWDEAKRTGFNRNRLWHFHGSQTSPHHPSPSPEGEGL